MRLTFKKFEPNKKVTERERERERNLVRCVGEEKSNSKSKKFFFWRAMLGLLDPDPLQLERN